MPVALGSAVAAPRAGRVATQVGRRFVAVGLGAVVLALLSGHVVLHVVGTSNPPRVALALPLLAAGIANGCVMSPNVTLTPTQVPAEQAGSAGGALQTAQRVGGALVACRLNSVTFW